MGTIRRFELKEFRCDVFFETGTGSGDSLAYAYEAGEFSELYSVEIHTETAQQASNRFADFDNIKIINSDSVTALGASLPGVDFAAKILFFLDAHFPGEVSREFKGYKHAEPKELKLPLPNELRIIKHLRPKSEDVIIVDDLRIYEDGPFENGNMPEWAQTLAESDRNLDFVCNTFPDRRIVKDYHDEGYLMILPRHTDYRLKKISLGSRFKRFWK